MEIEAAERLDTINSLILTPTGEEFKQAKLNLNHWKTMIIYPEQSILIKVK